MVLNSTSCIMSRGLYDSTVDIADSVDRLFGTSTCDSEQVKAEFFFYTFQGRLFFNSFWSAKLLFSLD